MVRCLRIAPALLLAVALATTAALADPVSAAGPHRGQTVPFASTDFLGRLWSLLANAWAKNGCEFDPNGHCKSGRTTKDPWVIPSGHSDGGRYK